VQAPVAARSPRRAHGRSGREAKKSDIDAAVEALTPAFFALAHLSGDIRPALQVKLHMTREQALEAIAP